MTLIILRIKRKLLTMAYEALPVLAVSKLVPNVQTLVYCLFCKKVFQNTAIPFGYQISLATFPPQWQRFSSCDRDPKANPTHQNITTFTEQSVPVRALMMCL